MKTVASQRGGTLIEMVIAIVIVSIALVGILSTINAATRASVDPVIQLQAVVLAENYSEEIYAMPYEEVQSLSWETIKSQYQGSHFVQAVDDQRFSIFLQVTPFNDAILPEASAKKIKIRVQHPQLPEDGFVLTGLRFKTPADEDFIMDSLEVPFNAG